MISVTHFKAEDCRDFSEIQKALQAWTSDAQGAIIFRMDHSGTFRTVRDRNRRVLMVCGFMPLHDGTVEAILFSSSHMKSELLSICRFLKDGVSYLAMQYQRVQMICLDEEMHFRLAEFLGFSFEGVLHKYNLSGQDYCMFARVR